MFDCSDDVLAYHDEEVNLPESDRSDMRDRRDVNRDRLKKGLKKSNKPAYRQCKSQGSYAMRLMVQSGDKDYDIDDGVYFNKEDLVGANGGEMTALEARKMVRDAVDDGKFKAAPEVRPKCVRVLYDEGYHVDLPVYRRVVEKNAAGKEVVHYELASSEWQRSDARDVTDWFDGECEKLNPDKTAGGQVRRITREIKKYARSRASWKGKILSGFGITKLVTECFGSNADREDKALRDTITAIRDRLNGNLVVKHPVTPNDTITKGSDDARAKLLRDNLSGALKKLEPLDKSDCSRKEALKCWDAVFSTTFFSDRLADDDEAASAHVPAPFSSGLLKSGATTGIGRAAVNKQGGGRYA